MKTATVYWTPYTQHSNCGWADILCEEPEPLLQHISKTGATAKSLQFLRCPAFLDSCKNTFIIKSPIDLVVTIDRANGVVSTDRYDQDFYNEFIYNRGADEGLPYLITLPPRYLMFADESIDVELLPLMVINSTSTENIDVIPGKYDAGKWVRPLDFTVAVRDDTKPIVLKVGDPLFLVRFARQDGAKVELKRVVVDAKIRKAVDACVTVKNVRQKLSLEELYKMASSFFTSLRS